MPPRFLAGLPGCLSLHQAAPVRQEGLHRGRARSRARSLTAFGVAAHGGRAFQEFSRGGVGLLRLIPGGNQWTLSHRTAAWPHLAPRAKWRRRDSSTIDPQAVPAAYLCDAQSAAECVAQWNRAAALPSAAYGRAACDLGLRGCVQRRTVYRGAAKFDSYSTDSQR